MSRVIDIADALVATVAAGSWPVAYDSVERAYLPVIHAGEAEDGETRITVVPAGWNETPLNRAQWDTGALVDLAVQRKTAKAALDECDPVLDLMEAIVDAVKGKRLEGVSPSPFCSSLVPTLFIPQHLDQWNVMTVVARFTFDKAK